MSEDIIVKNITRCRWCGGSVDRYEHCLICSKCESVGDLVTGIMGEPFKK